MEHEQNPEVSNNSAERLRVLSVAFDQHAQAITELVEPVMRSLLGGERYDQMKEEHDIEMDMVLNLDDAEFHALMGLDAQGPEPDLEPDPFSETDASLEAFERSHLGGSMVGQDEHGPFLQSARSNEVIGESLSTSYTRYRSFAGEVVAEHYRYVVGDVEHDQLRSYLQATIASERKIGLNGMPISELEAQLLVDQLASLHEELETVSRMDQEQAQAVIGRAAEGEES